MHASASEETQPTDETDSHLLAFPSVGIGGSAGGIEAYIELFQHLPAATGMAFVVSHLAPDHKSHLVEILASRARIPVEEIRDRTAPEPDCIYVLPPNTTLRMHKGVLELNLNSEIN